MKTLNVTAPRLKILLIVAQVLILLAGVGIFAFFYQTLSGYAGEVKNAKTQSRESEEKLRQLVLTEKSLASKQDVISKAAAIVASRASYQYQNQVVNDLSSYATRNNVSISKIDFSTANTTTTATTSTAAATPAPSSDGPTPTKVVISLASPIKYENLMNFIYEIEKNLTKMQINKLGFSLLEEENVPPGSLAETTIELEVYIK